MPKYLVTASYTQTGVNGVLKDGGTGRRAAVEKLFASVGGKVEAFYFAFGENDVYVIADAPDNVTAASLSITVNATGTSHCRVVPLLTPEEVDQATKMSPSYRAPGA